MAKVSLVKEKNVLRVDRLIQGRTDNILTKDGKYFDSQEDHTNGRLKIGAL